MEEMQDQAQQRIVARAGRRTAERARRKRVTDWKSPSQKDIGKQLFEENDAENLPPQQLNQQQQSPSHQGMKVKLKKSASFKIQTPTQQQSTPVVKKMPMVHTPANELRDKRKAKTPLSAKSPDHASSSNSPSSSSAEKNPRRKVIKKKKEKSSPNAKPILVHISQVDLKKENNKQEKKKEEKQKEGKKKEKKTTTNNETKKVTMLSSPIPLTHEYETTSPINYSPSSPHIEDREQYPDDDSDSDDESPTRVLKIATTTNTTSKNGGGGGKNVLVTPKTFLKHHPYPNHYRGLTPTLKKSNNNKNSNSPYEGGEGAEASEDDNDSEWTLNQSMSEFGDLSINDDESYADDNDESPENENETSVASPSSVRSGKWCKRYVCACALLYIHIQ
jgi:hypothetical protein